MQASQVKHAMPRIERVIDHAAELCQLTNNVPPLVRECLGELERESDAAMHMLSDDWSDQRVRDCVAHLEKLGDRAVQACNQAGSLDDEVAEAVRKAHDALSVLKHDLH
jgi:hypothetical protein